MNISEATVFIVDDDSAVRDSLMLMIEQEGIRVETYGNGEDFLSVCQNGIYGCAILDIRMPGMDGMQLQQELNRRNIKLPIVFLTGHGDIPLSVKAVKTGAVDFLTKPVTRENLLSSVKSALLESQRLVTQLENGQDAKSKLADLTEREREVMTLAVAGSPNKEIARRLGISHRTVEIHKSKIMHKTGATNLLDLARIASEGRLLE
ncbi:response regulator transcription factor [Methylotenera sp. G11]|uniref:response regulator transcription factor n=1 Tax=Methylotenera sp. G11 TaxID=1506585 RepID=UPI0006477F5E|nr:response regulator [Methylotenera sp. G11]